MSGPAYQLERAFIDLGCTCERFTLDDLGIRTVAVPGGRPLVALVRFWRDIVAFSVVGSLLLRMKFGGRRRDPRTVVLCHVDALYGDTFVVRSLHKAFLEHHPSRTRMILRNPLHALVLVRDWIRFKWNVHRHLVALSQGNKDDIVRLYSVPPETISVIPNGVDVLRFQRSEMHRQDVRKALALADGTFVAIFVGHEFERKGLRVVLEAIRLLRQRGITIQVIVAGSDSPDRLKAEFSDLAGQVRFVGLRQDIERYYAAADVFVLPASFDISPLAGLEALASGLPILMTDLGGVREYLRDGENGWFIVPEAGDVAAKLARLISDKDLYGRMSTSARAFAADRDWRTIARWFLELMDRVVPLPVPDGEASPPPVEMLAGKPND